MIRLEITIHYPVRAHKGERRGPGGCLVKTLVSHHPDAADARHDFELTKADRKFGHIASAFTYDRDTFEADLAKWAGKGPFNPTVLETLA